MTDTSILTWLFAIVVGAVSFIPYSVWMIVTATKKQWKRFRFQLAAPLLIMVSLVIGTRLIDSVTYRSYLHDIYDSPVVFQSPIYEYHSERSFQGDGYSIIVYDLPDTVRSRFQAPDYRLLTEFPKRPEYRDHWETECWREAPLDPTFEDHLSFSLSTNDANNESDLSEHFKNIRTALERKGTFYACFKYDPGHHLGDIDLFIVDLHRRLIYHINHNT